jgi:type IV pilus assembly protein PilW
MEHRAGNHRRRSTGLSIVELMVAIALGGILLAGAVSLFINNRDTSRVTNELARMQESARFAMEIILRDLRMAGYFGCQDDLTTLNSLVTVDAGAGETGSLWDPTFPIEGFDPVSDATLWFPSGYATNLGALPLVGTDGDNGQILAGTDAFVIRYLQGSYVDADADNIPDAEVSTSTTTSVTVNNLDTAEFDELGAIAAVSDCGGTNVFVVDVDPTGSNTLAVYTAAGTKALARTYDASNRPIVAPYVAKRYYVGRNTRGNPALYRVGIRHDDRDVYAELPQELFEGVENMQILYGVDTDIDGAPDAFLPAGDPSLDDATEWRQVVAVKVAIMVRSGTQHQFGGDVTGNNFDLLDVTVTPGDSFRRRVFTSMAVLRNLQ